MTWLAIINSLIRVLSTEWGPDFWSPLSALFEAPRFEAPRFVSADLNDPDAQFFRAWLEIGA